MIEKIIYRLNKKGISLSLNGDKIKISADIQPTEEDLNLIRNNRELIIDYIQRRTSLVDPIDPITEQTDYRLSSSQRRLWVLSKFDAASEAYNMPQLFRLHGRLNDVAFIKAYSSVLERHEILRTVFIEDTEGNPRQRILLSTDTCFSVSYKDYSEQSKEDSEQSVKDYIAHEMSLGFNLEQGPLIRCSLLKESEHSYVVVLMMHHIVSDGWSLGIMHREWSEFYNAILEERQPDLEPLRIQYKDYAAWHNTQLESESIQHHKAYWLEQFSGELPILELPVDHPRPKVMTYNGASVYKELDQQTTDRLRAFSQEQGGTMFMTIQTALLILLHKYTGQEDIVIGSPIAGREHPDLEGQIGFYLGALPLRTNFSKGETLVELYQKVKHNVLGAYDHQVYPYDALVDSLNLKRDTSRNPLFDFWFDYHSQDIETDHSGFKDVVQENYPLLQDNLQSKFDITLIVQEKQDGCLGFYWEYNRDMFSASQMQQMLSHLFSVLQKLSTHNSISVTNYKLLETEDEQMQLSFNPVQTPFDKRTVLERFAETVKNHSDKVAVIWDSKEINYGALDELSNRFAHHLINEYGLAQGDLVGIKMNRSLGQIVSVLGILKTGAAYVPIDPSYPNERILFMEKDSGTRVILDEEEWDNFQLHRALYSATKPDRLITPEDAMYVIYTSGSTGLPKGCVLNYEGVSNYLDWAVEYSKDITYSEVDFFSSLAFDFTVTSLFVALTTGKTLRVYDNNKDLSLQLNQIVNNQNSGWLKLTPAHISLIEEETLKTAKPKVFVVGGEALTVDQINHLRKNAGCRIYNEYGPTEATVGCIVKEIAEDNLPFIGRPIQNTEVFLLDDSLQMVPYGCVGELYIGGAGLARGYLNRVSLTNEKFIDNPFKPGKRCYKTGDLGRWRENGILEYLGRIDDQVKIKGYRIELGEIDQVLSGHPKLDQSLVVARDINHTSNKELIVYYTGEAKAEELKAYLQKKLPGYMVPNFYVKLERIPLTSNGKVDRNALPDPDDTGMQQGGYVAPVTEAERQMVKIWSEVLRAKFDKIGLESDFFALGGDSIKAIQILARLRNAGYDLKMSDVLNSSRLKEMTAKLRLLSRIINQEPVEGEVILSPIQRAFLENAFAKGSDQEKQLFHQSFMFCFPGGISTTEAKVIVEKLMSHHDALRLRFEKSRDGKWSQYNAGLSQVDFIIEESTIPHDMALDVTAIAKFFEDQGSRLKMKLGFVNAPLLGVGVYHNAETKESHFLMSVHHLVIDLVSWRILFEDIETLLTQFRNGSELKLPDKTDSYKFWMERSANYAGTYALEQQRSYWEYQQGTITDSLPIKKPLGKNTIGNSSIIDLTLDKDQTTKLKTSINSVNKVETNALLLAALSRAIKDVFNIEQIRILLEGHGREEFIEDIDISRTIGWFTSMFPFLLNASKENAQTVFMLQDALNQIPDKGVGYGLLRYSSKNPLQTLKDVSLTFNYLGDLSRDDNNVFSVSQDKSQEFRSLFDYSDYGHGTDAHPNLERESFLLVSGHTLNGSLSISLQFNKECVEEQHVQLLADRYKVHLLNIAEELLDYSEIVQLPSSLTYKKLSIEQLKKLQIDHGEIEDIFPLNASQLGLLYLNETVKESGYYIEQFIDEFKGALEVDKWLNALKLVVAKNQALRVIFRNDITSEPLQICLKNISIDHKYYDFSDLSIDELNNNLDRLIKSDYSQVFDLNHSPPFRLIFIKINEDKFIRIWTNHHISMDGWSTQIFFKQWENHYCGRKSEAYSVPSLNDYFKFIALIDKEETKKYWDSYLLDYEKSISIVPLPIRQVDTPNSGDLTYSIPSEVYLKLSEFSKKNKLTLSGIIQSLFGILLAKLNNTSDVVFSSVVSGRPNAVKNIENLIFNFINIIPVRIKFDENDTFLSLFQLTSNFFFEVEKYQYLPLNDSCQSIPGAGASIKVLFVFENYPSSDVNKVTDEEYLESNRIQVNDKLEFDLTVLCGVEQDELKFIWKPALSVYSKEHIDFIFHLFTRLVSEFLEENEKKISAVSLLDDTSKQEIALLSCGLEIKEEFLDFGSLFTKTAINYPNATAIVGLENNYSYTEVDELSNEIANYLLTEKSLKKGDVIAVELSRSEWIPISFLGIAKAGMVFLYIDQNYPQNRKSYLRENGEVKYVLDQTALNEIQHFGALISTEVQGLVYHESDLLYLIYTSGTTGNPKGCGLTHGNMFNLKLFMERQTDIMYDMPKVLQYTTWSFDLSVQELINALLSGGQLICTSEQDRTDYTKLVNRMMNTKAEVFYLSPSLLNSLIGFEPFRYGLSSLKKLVSAGEQLFMSSSVNSLLTDNKIKIFNFYGPAETHVVTSKEIDFDKLTHKPDIGKPICNNQVYIFDHNFNLLPYGVSGEVYIAGKSVGSGYVNNKTENKKRFILHDSFGKLYKTGDIAYRDFEGNIHYLGRTDDQVKINGVRIELDEIVKNVKLNGHIVNAIAIIIESITNIKQIAVFYEGDINEPELRNDLTSKLPSHYMPSLMFKLDKIPLNANGKIDKNQLRALVKPNINTEVMAPKTWLQQEILNVLSDLMKIPSKEIGLDKSFFELGMTSLQYIHFVSELNTRFKRNLNIKDVMDTHNIAGLYASFMKPERRTDKLLYSLTGNFDFKKPVVVLFPAYFGEGLYYLHLANHLKQDFNVFSCNYHTEGEEQFDTDLFARNIAKELEDIKSDRIILGGASYGFRVAYRVTYYTSAVINEIFNFDGSVYNDFIDEFETIISINNYEIAHFDSIDKEDRIRSLNNYISEERKIKYINDYYIGTLMSTDIYNFYPKNSAVKYFTRQDLTHGNIYDIEIDGDHETMLTHYSNILIITKYLKSE
jgi:amino acid adenylation domain-containing protein/non-ribosomal peptide synthase protein (TIGR01720 family)